MNLFTELTPQIEFANLPKKALSDYKRIKLTSNYRKAETKDQRCKNCKNLYRYRYHDKVYHKCRMIGISRQYNKSIKVKR